MKRTTKIKQEKEVVVLATAYPSPLYRYYGNMKPLIIEARLVGSSVRFYEIDTRNNKTNLLKQELVRELFPLGKSKTEQPFRKQGNESFYAVLYQDRSRYKPVFEAIIKNKEHHG